MLHGLKLNPRMSRFGLALLIYLAACLHASGLELASPFTEHMILQRQMPVPVWGWGNPGERVEVSVAGQSASGKIGKDGRWKVSLKALPAGGPYLFEAKSGKESIEFSDVLVGEVWICSGQSNMQFGYNKLTDYKALLEAAKKRPIRSLTVERNVRLTPQERFSGDWLLEPCQSAVGFIFAYELQQALGIPVGIIETSWGSSSIEGWMPLSMTKQLPHFKREMEAFETFDRNEVEGFIEQNVRGENWERDDQVYLRTRPNILYNAMMYPIAPYAVRGLAWYQGEADSGSLANMRQYGESLPAWCTHLRKLWGRNDFYFMGVMLPRFGRTSEGSPTKSPTAPDAYSWAWFRESQTRLLDLPHTAIVNTIDLGDLENIHPTDKEPVGKRMALLAQQEIHGKDVISSGPVFAKWKTEGNNRIRILFQHAENLHTSDGKAPREFWVAGPDRNWQPAQARLDGESVLLTWEGKTKPNAIRYAFSAFPEVNLLNGADLPAMPFRTDSDVPPGYNDEPPLVADKHRKK
jgi:sialate O-acetylesterase